MAIYYNIGRNEADIQSEVIEWQTAQGTLPQYRTNIAMSGRHVFSVTGANMDVTLIGNAPPTPPRASQGHWAYTYVTYTERCKVTETNDKRACIYRVPCKLFAGATETSDTTYFYIPLSNGTNAISYISSRGSNVSYDRMSANGLNQSWNNDYTPYNRTFVRYATSVVNNISGNIRPVDSSEFLQNLSVINSRVDNFCIPDAQANSSKESAYGFILSNLGTISQGTGYSYKPILNYNEFPLKVFEYENVDGVIKYLQNGDDSGAIDPFDPNNPSIVTVTDYKTNFDAYVTLGDPSQPYAGFTNIHWSIRALNEQYNEARDLLEGMYRLSVYNTPIRRQGESATGIEYKTTYAQVPVASFTAPIPNLDTSHNVIQFYFGDSSYDLLAPELVGNTSGFFLIDYHYKKGSRSKCKIDKVKFSVNRFSPDWEHEGVELTRTSIGTDAYKYTASTGETLTIYFRGITLEDLNKTDDGYKENPDTEASPTESDVGVVSGSGLNTFSISKAQFNLINTALWSTDWTQVFKSSTIDPIKCVIACKGIKFANAGSGEVPIIIANRDTEVSSGVVNPVKSYTIDNCYIPAINGNFTDITLMRVRCYLPYIGWVDLPSAEVVGRLGYNGVQAVDKRLTFKYIVDFIDGACRCVVSVNGTERWMFDGNCAVDIPVTSDNHTNAIGTAIKSGLATTLSIATGVAGAISGNAGAVAGGVIGAVNNAPNMLPTYEYSASASPSGYVNGSCNSHIMIVCEIPNVQIPNGFARKVGRPCERNLSLGSLVGFTQCKNVNVSGINATTEELTMIAQELNSGVYL